MCVALPGRITSIADVAGLLTGTVDFDGTERQVCLAYLPDARIGDYVLVSAGFAVRIIDEAETQQMLALLRSCGPAE